MDKNTRHEPIPTSTSTNPGISTGTTYWRHACGWTLLGLVLWFGVTFGVSWWAHALDTWHIGRMPAGYWWATQGAIGVYLFIIVVHGWLMDRLERRTLTEGDQRHG